MLKWFLALFILCGTSDNSFAMTEEDSLEASPWGKKFIYVKNGPTTITYLVPDNFDLEERRKKRETLLALRSNQSHLKAKSNLENFLNSTQKEKKES